MEMQTDKGADIFHALNQAFVAHIDGATLEQANRAIAALLSSFARASCTTGRLPDIQRIIAAIAEHAMLQAQFVAEQGDQLGGPVN